MDTGTRVFGAMLLGIFIAIGVFGSGVLAINQKNADFLLGIPIIIFLGSCAIINWANRP